MPDEIELSYDDEASVPASYKGLYENKEGKFVLAGVKGMKTNQDIMNVQEGLRKEREDHGKTRELIKTWKALGDDPAKIQERLDRMGELELAAGGKLDQAGIDKIVESRLVQKTSPLERKIKELETSNSELSGNVNSLLKTIEKRDLSEAIRQVAIDMKVVPTAISDIEFIASNYFEKNESGEFVVKADAKGVTPGSDVRGFLKDMQKSKPHWWPASSGGGANGKGLFANADDNPWSAKGWNITKQGQYIRENGAAKAEEAAKAAGSFVGATGPKMN